LKKLQISFFILSLLCTAIAAAKVQTEEPKLFRVQKDGKVGFIDNTGKVVIPITLSIDTGNFLEGLAPVKTDSGVWEYIDETGNPKINLGSGYAGAGSFNEGLAVVQNGNNAFGYIDKQGHEAIKPQYKMAFDFSGGYASAQSEGQKPMFIDKNGNAAFPEYVPTLFSFSDGLAFVTLKSDTRFPPSGGYIDQAGKLVIPCEYTFSAIPCTEGVVIAVKDRVWMAARLSLPRRSAPAGNYHQFERLGHQYSGLPDGVVGVPALVPRPVWMA
jgi:hypothetical protein